MFDTRGALDCARYLQYEGGSHSEIIGHNCSSVDSVGLARSKDIRGPWVASDSPYVIARAVQTREPCSGSS